MSDVTKDVPSCKLIPKSAMTAFVLLLAAQERDKQELARTVCEEIGMPINSAFDLKAGTVTAPSHTPAQGLTDGKAQENRPQDTANGRQ